ncbi:DNA-binding protein WhiA [Corynebacterium terpenotabidum]|uniref:DNA-binding protein WhiA n=1 Tax=Corynebacterium terpenotabidum TaxID=89154 RepID=UPI0005A1EF9C|nr:DNA-binding protein WhiA [Corynebacterium terpenotabidum]
MSLTAEVRQELLRVTVSHPAVLTAEVASLLRYTCALHLVDGQIVVEAEVEGSGTARRLAAAIEELFHLSAEPGSVPPTPTAGEGGVPGAAEDSVRHRMRWSTGGTELSRRTGLIDRGGHPVRGLPPYIINGTGEQCAAAWRGAFLAHGSVGDPGRPSVMEVTTPSNEAAVALVGAARRLGVTAKTRELRGMFRVVVRDQEGVGSLLEQMGAVRARARWDALCREREAKAGSHRLANFDDANQRRSTRAAAAAATRVERALALLGEDVPEHLFQAGSLRVKHREASLEELGQLAEPPMTKDAVAGRIRRLLTMADRRAKELGVPDTAADAEVDDRE